MRAASLMLLGWVSSYSSPNQATALSAVDSPNAA